MNSDLRIVGEYMQSTKSLDDEGLGFLNFKPEEFARSHCGEQNGLRFFAKLQDLRTCCGFSLLLHLLIVVQNTL